MNLDKDHCNVNLAIAKYCGWYDIQFNLSETVNSGHIGQHPLLPPYAYHIPYQGYDKQGAHRCDYGAPIPSYTSDLNAMHKAESLLSASEWTAYTTILGDPKTAIHASAHNRAKAFYTVITNERL